MDGRILYTGVKNVFTNYHATENSRLVDSGSGKKTSHSVRPVRLYGRPDKSISHNQHLYIYIHTQRIQRVHVSWKKKNPTPNSFGCLSRTVWVSTIYTQWTRFIRRTWRKIIWPIASLPERCRRLLTHWL